jgi:hypothetical protein
VIDRELYPPRSWTQGPQRLTEARVPGDVEFLTNPALASGMITARCTPGCRHNG